MSGAVSSAWPAWPWGSAPAANLRRNPPRGSLPASAGTLTLVSSTLFILFIVLMTALPTHFYLAAEAASSVTDVVGRAHLQRWFFWRWIAGTAASLLPVPSPRFSPSASVFVPSARWSSSTPITQTACVFAMNCSRGTFSLPTFLRRNRILTQLALLGIQCVLDLPIAWEPLSGIKGNVVKTARILYGLVAVAYALASMPAWAQRMQFATPVDATSSAAPSNVAAATVTPPSSPYVAPPVKCGCRCIRRLRPPCRSRRRRSHRLGQ